MVNKNCSVYFDELCLVRLLSPEKKTKRESIQIVQTSPRLKSGYAVLEFFAVAPHLKR